ncbi:hypothetical protein AKL17_3070 [Frigidibacter mobilis]|uniref:Uncharacterized protein n=1 Tax=Frigidibacter mobilis TaxID=1335048 RepID=A0A161GK42_9RHOB|nr:hypothetical protein AKL17_3070 [Frigidibacter mobilis]
MAGALLEAVDHPALGRDIAAAPGLPGCLERVIGRDRGCGSELREERGARQAGKDGRSDEALQERSADQGHLRTPLLPTTKDIATTDDMSASKIRTPVKSKGTKRRNCQGRSAGCRAAAALAGGAGGWGRPNWTSARPSPAATPAPRAVKGPAPGLQRRGDEGGVGVRPQQQPQPFRCLGVWLKQHGDAPPVCQPALQRRITWPGKPDQIGPSPLQPAIPCQQPGCGGIAARARARTRLGTGQRCRRDRILQHPAREAERGQRNLAG